MELCELSVHIYPRIHGDAIEYLSLEHHMNFTFLGIDLSNDIYTILHYSDVMMSVMASQITFVDYLPNRLFRRMSRK